MAKAPRRTAERILEVTLVLFNRFGEPNVSTTLISAELNISPGNLYYHYPAKDELVNSLFERYQTSLHQLLAAAPEVADVEDAWFFMHSLLEGIWHYRFLYRDLNDLLTKNRKLEAELKDMLLLKTSAFRALLQSLAHHGVLDMDASAREMTATHMVVMLTWWLSYEYVRDPRHAMEDDHAQHSLLRGAQHVLGLLLPYMVAPARTHLQHLMRVYAGTNPQAPATKAL
jgi:AcrR family transcriptional regulator